MAHQEIAEALAGAELHTIDIPKRPNYDDLISWPIVRRSYEDTTLHYLVFKPFNSNYDPGFNGIEHIRKYLSGRKIYPAAMIITREITSAKVHYNLMMWVCEDHDFYLEGKQTSRYRISHQIVTTQKDKYNVHEYIIKESKHRYFETNIDIYVPNSNTVRALGRHH